MRGGQVLMGIGIVSMLYFVAYAILVDLNNKFTYFWLALGILFLAAGFLIYQLYKKGKELPKWFVLSGGGLCTGIVLFFGIIIGILVYYAYQTPGKNADYLIILGARVKGDKISSLLQYRLDRGLEYLEENPDTIVVVSGGRGTGENLSEAEAMKRYLIKNGISENQIISEDQSTNTDENIRYSLKKIAEYERESLFLQEDTMNQNESDFDSKPEKSNGVNGIKQNRNLIILSNGFHIYRATHIVKKQLENLPEDMLPGETIVEGLGAKTRWYVVPNSYVREVFGVVKYKLSGQI